MARAAPRAITIYEAVKPEFHKMASLMLAGSNDDECAAAHGVNTRKWSGMKRSMLLLTGFKTQQEFLRASYGAPPQNAAAEIGILTRKQAKVGQLLLEGRTPKTIGGRLRIKAYQAENTRQRIVKKTGSMGAFFMTAHIKPPVHAKSPDEEKNAFDFLTPPQKKLFSLLLSGHSIHEITKILPLSYSGILSQRKRIYEALGVESPESLFKFAYGAPPQEFLSLEEFLSLDPREQNIVRLTLEGKTVKEISDSLEICLASIYSDMKRIYEEFDILSSAELFMLAHTPNFTEEPALKAQAHMAA